jgi:hypothetical protein
MILVVALKPMKALLSLTIRGIKDNYSDSFEPHKRGERQFKPSNQFRNRNWVRVGPSLPANAKFYQVNADFNQGNALKRLKTLGRAVSVIEMAPPFQLVSAAGSLLDPPFDCKRGGVCIRTPELKFFNFL